MTENIEERLITKAKLHYAGLHSRIIGQISSMLKIAKLEPMHNLIDLDPSFSSQVATLEDYIKVLNQLRETLGISIDDINEIRIYIDLARNLAKSIDGGCSDTLGAAIAALDEKPYI